MSAPPFDSSHLVLTACMADQSVKGLTQFLSTKLFVCSGRESLYLFRLLIEILIYPFYMLETIVGDYCDDFTFYK